MLDEGGTGLRGHSCHWQCSAVPSGRVKILASLAREDQGAGGAREGKRC